MQRILFVDDEPFLLAALRRSLRSKRDEWEMHFCEDGNDALRVFDQHPVDALVTDMRMPKMTGSELVNEVVLRKFDTARVLLTGQSEQQSILPCLGLVHRFLTKPCEPNHLVQTLDALLLARRRIQREDLRSALTNLNCLPIQARQREAFEVELSLDDPDLERLGLIASGDVGMTVRLLQLTLSLVSATRDVDVYPRSMVETIGVETLQSLNEMGALFPTHDFVTHQFNLEAFNARCVKLAMMRAAEQKDESLINATWLAAMLRELGTLALVAMSSTDDCVRTETPSERADDCSVVAEYLLSLWTPGIDTLVCEPA